VSQTMIIVLVDKNGVPLEGNGGLNAHDLYVIEQALKIWRLHHVPGCPPPTLDELIQWFIDNTKNNEVSNG